MGSEEVISMPYSVGSQVTFAEEYVVSYTKKGETVTASAPTKEDVKQLFEWLATRVDLITAVTP